MHHVDRSRVRVDVSLDTRLLGIVRVQVETPINNVTKETQTEPPSSLNQGENHPEDHCSHKGVADYHKPGLIKITLESTNKAEGEWLLSQVSVD
jgi:hypothetical protein